MPGSARRGNALGNIHPVRSEKDVRQEKLVTRCHTAHLHKYWRSERAGMFTFLNKHVQYYIMLTWRQLNPACSCYCLTVRPVMAIPPAMSRVSGMASLST